MKHNPILVADLYVDNVYHLIEPDFWNAPLSGSAKGLYLLIISLGNSQKNTINTLLSLGCGSRDEVLRGLAELDRAGFETSNLVRA